MKPTKDIETAIKKLLESDVTGYKIYMDTGIDRARISRLRNQEYDLNNTTWHVIKALYDYSNKINKKEMIKMTNLNFIKDTNNNYNTLFESFEQLETAAANYIAEGNEELGRRYLELDQEYNTPFILQDSPNHNDWHVLEITDDTTNDAIVEFCANGNRKDYPKIKLSEIDNYEQVNDLNDLYVIQIENEYGTVYVDNIDNALWVQDLANAYKYLNEKEIDWNDYTINDYDDVIKLAEDL